LFGGTSRTHVVVLVTGCPEPSSPSTSKIMRAARRLPVLYTKPLRFLPALDHSSLKFRSSVSGAKSWAAAGAPAGPAAPSRASTVPRPSSERVMMRLMYSV